jgi:glutamate-ammonia-ligase adenylyltransferase
LKLGSGGIRDIEFFVNAQQLLWGGRYPHLQTPSTMTALQGLAAEGIVEPETAAEMERCYWLLRGLENRVQYWADGHTHFVPEDPAQQEWLAERSGARSWAELGREIADVRQFVDQTVSPLFADVERPATTTVPDSDIAEDDEFIKDRLQTWEQEAGSGKAPGWIWDHASQTADPLDSMKAADGLFRRLGNRGQYLKLLSNDPKLFEAVVPPLFQAPAMTSLLQQSAHVVDGLLGRAGVLPVGPELDQGRAMIAAAGSYEGKLEAARAWVNEQLYLTYLSVFNGSATIKSAELHLTQLAEAALTLVADMVMEDLGLDAFPLCILGMGKMGMRAMAPHSDLDLIFVVEEGWELEDANVVAARFNTAFNAQMREGRVWEVDTRLRPSGRSGPPTISLASFETHHLERAKTWEHIAQVPMRPLSGSEALRRRVNAVKQRVLRRPRDLTQLTADAHRMLLRLRDQRIYDRPDDPSEVKLRPGGLMELEYLLAVETLRGGAERPEAAVVEHDDLAMLWGETHPELTGAHEDLRRLRDWFFAGRLFGPQWMQRLGITIDDIESVAHRVSNAVDWHLDSQAKALNIEWVEYQEQAVRWTDDG